MITSLYAMLSIAYAKFWPDFVIADLILCTAALVAVPLSRWILLRERYKRSSNLNLILSILVPALLPAWSVWLVSSHDWPGIQGGTLLAHAYVLAMKMHSYMTVNLWIRTDHRTDLGMPCQRCALSYGNYLHFLLLLPTLIYRPRYERAERIRWSYMVDRTAGILAILGILSTIIEHSILPVLTNSAGRVEAVLSLLIPMAVASVLIFFLVFEYILNWFAELGRYTDRHFYDDWWNSTSLDQFARKWNVPVHQFLRFHVYGPLATVTGRCEAMLATFLVSAILHEIGMAVISGGGGGGRVKGIFFAIQMAQLPVIWMGAWSGLPRRFPRLSNMVFWCGMILGLSIIAVLYSD